MDTLVIGKNANKGSACCGFIQTNKHKKKSPDFAVGKKTVAVFGRHVPDVLDSKRWFGTAFGATSHLQFLFAQLLGVAKLQSNVVTLYLLCPSV